MTKPSRDYKTEQDEKPSSNLIDDLIEDTGLISTIVDIIIVFLASFIAIIKSRKEITQQIQTIQKCSNHDNKCSKLITKEISSTLSKIQALSCCDRIILGLFHKSRTGEELFSAKYELINVGISPIIEVVKDVPRWKLSSEKQLMQESSDGVLFAYVSDEQIIAGEVIQEMEDKCRNHLMKIGVVCTYELLLSNGEDKGIIGIQYLSKETYKLSAFEHNRVAILELRDYLVALLD